MKFASTRSQAAAVTAAQAIYQGLAADGGLFVPQDIPQIRSEDLTKMAAMNYAQRAAYILSYFLTDYSGQELTTATDGAYSEQNFPGSVAPVVNIDAQNSVLELWHGKTSAFKDMALQILPYLLTMAVKKEQIDKQILILVATSGDTGKAALEGFQDIPGTKIAVFYPVDGVSDIQKLQMATQEGDNVHVFVVKGNFDDAQTGVKKIFADEHFKKQIADKGYLFSSANSINWGRLVPQIVYYFSAYIDLVTQRVIKNGDKVNFSVPTGNFGNILAGYYAKCMGLPVHKLICASNANNVLTDFINTGVYDRRRSFYQTNSPSMDILISSNLERFLYLMSDKDTAWVADCMQLLNTVGCYAVPPTLLNKIQAQMAAYSCSEAQTCAQIQKMYREHKYLLDTHTAVAYLAAQEYRQATGDRLHTVTLSTASAFKFSADVLKALGSTEATGDSFAQNKLLSELTGQSIPARIRALENAVVRHEGIVEKQEMFAAINAVL